MKGRAERGIKRTVNRVEMAVQLRVLYIRHSTLFFFYKDIAGVLHALKHPAANGGQNCRALCRALIEADGRNGAGEHIAEHPLPYRAVRAAAAQRHIVRANAHFL